MASNTLYAARAFGGPVPIGLVATESLVLDDSATSFTDTYLPVDALTLSESVAWTQSPAGIGFVFLSLTVRDGVTIFLARAGGITIAARTGKSAATIARDGFGTSINARDGVTSVRVRGD